MFRSGSCAPHPCACCAVAVVVLLGRAILPSSTALAQSKPPPTAAPSAAPGAAPTSAPADDLLKPQELEALLAPIALYPDSLITQMLMASTYPLEIVQADRWAKQNKNLKGDALAKELEKQSWDPSVRSLVNFPDVLTMMSEKLDLTIKIGDAFIAQQADVMNTIQVLRNKANSQGQLKTNEQQKVIVEAAPPPDTTIVVQQPAPTQIIKIEPTQPEVIYVPSYNPTVVYGAWPYPSYPPYPYYPPGYVASNMMSFGLGVAAGAAWGYAWGNSDWGSNNVDIDVDRNTNINNNIDRSKYKNEISNRQTDRQGNRQGQGQGRGQGSWSHNPEHRGGAPYRDQKTADRMGKGNQTRQAAQARDQYRGRAEAGRSDLARNPGGANAGNRATAQPRNNAGGANQGNRAGAANSGNRAGASAGNRSGSGSSFSGVDRGGSQAKAASQRGQSSRSSSASSSSRGGGSRSSGASRGGGGRSGGGGGGGGGRGGGGGGGRGRSDVELKANFAVIDPYQVLQRVVDMPITTWNFKDDPQTRHLGPMAQDFHHAFGLGEDDKTITFLDEGGVALAAIQGLNAKLEEKDAQLRALEKEVAELKALVQELSRKARMESGSGSGN